MRDVVAGAEKATRVDVNVAIGVFVVAFAAAVLIASELSLVFACIAAVCVAAVFVASAVVAAVAVGERCCCLYCKGALASTYDG